MGFGKAGAEILQQSAKAAVKHTPIGQVAEEFAPGLYRFLMGADNVNNIKLRSKNHPGSFSPNFQGSINSGQLENYVEGLPQVWKSDFEGHVRASDPDEVADFTDLLVRGSNGESDAKFSIMQAAKALELERTAKGKRTKLEKLQQGPTPVPETKPYQLSEGVEDFMGDTDLESARTWLQPDGELDQLAESKFLTAGSKRKVKDPTGKTIEVQKGAKLTRDQLSKTDQDYYDSLMATGFKTSPDDELAYGFGASELSKMSVLEGFDPEFSPQLHKGKTFHHKGMKKIRSTIHKRARQLVREGKATTDDLVNLHAMSVEKGSPSGSRQSAGMWLEEFGHNITHKKVSQDPEFGYEPTTTKAVNQFRGGDKTKPKNISAKVWNPAKKAALDLNVELTPFDIEYINVWAATYKDLDKAIARWKVFRQSNAYDLLKPDGLSEMDRLLEPVDNMSIAELTRFQKELIDDIDTPMTEDMILMEEVIDKLSARELIELQKNKDWDSLLNLRKTLEEKKGDISEVQANEKMRQMGG
jgi:hypothetical protein